MAAMILSSGSFVEGGVIPARHTCDGRDLSPALAWSPAPDATRSLCLICDDPDAPGRTWVHWLLYDLPASARSLPEGLPQEASLPSGARQGTNDFGRIGYGGPCPPRGPAHRYRFTLYALDAPLALPAGATRAQVDSAMAGHQLAEARLTGRYGR